MVNAPFPFVLGASTQSLMQDFDTDVYNTSSSSLIYKIVDALCGSTGAGQLLNQNFINTLQNDLSTTYGSDLDYFFGNIGFLPRAPSEMYIQNSSTDLLTSDEWDQVAIADAQYRARISDFWKACNMGGTPEAIRMTVQAAVSCDCNIYEIWREVDNFGLTGFLGRADARNEVVIQPLKGSLTPQEFKLLRDMLARIMPVETIVTINPLGLAVLSPVTIGAACANSTYFEVQKMVTPTPVISLLPSPAQLAIELLESERWLFNPTPQLAPHARHNFTAQFSYHYLMRGGKASQIDSVTYSTLNADGTTTAVPNFIAYQSSSNFTPWTSWAKADSPDNWPGGRYGIHPDSAPALNADGTPYNFPWDSQADYVTAQITIVLNLGGNANEQQYQLPVQAPNQTSFTFLPEYAVAYFPPGRDSTVSANNFRNRQIGESGLSGWSSTVGFVRS